MVDQLTVEIGRRYNRNSFHLQEGEISYTLNLCDYLRQYDVCVATPAARRRNMALNSIQAC